MAGSLKKLASRITGGQKGFTLIEMIVVVGIIAVLAAVIVPNIGKFIGSGEQGAKDAEFESVQTAMSAMMADKAITALDASGLNSSNDWSALPTGTDVSALALYLQSSSTVYFCWDVAGNLTNNPAVGGDEVATAC